MLLLPSCSKDCEMADSGFRDRFLKAYLTVVWSSTCCLADYGLSPCQTSPFSRTHSSSWTRSCLPRPPLQVVVEGPAHVSWPTPWSFPRQHCPSLQRSAALPLRLREGLKLYTSYCGVEYNFWAPQIPDHMVKLHLKDLYNLGQISSWVCKSNVTLLEAVRTQGRDHFCSWSFSKIALKRVYLAEMGRGSEIRLRVGRWRLRLYGTPSHRCISGSLCCTSKEAPACIV